MRKVKNTKLFKEFSRELIQKVYKKLDFLWNTGQFIPCPIRLISREFCMTETQALYLILGWKEYQYRMDRSLT